MNETKDMKKQTASIQFKGLEILIQETNDGVVVDIYEAGENPSTGLLGSTQVFFDDTNEKTCGFVQGNPIHRLTRSRTSEECSFDHFPRYQGLAGNK